MQLLLLWLSHKAGNLEAPHVLSMMPFAPLIYYLSSGLQKTGSGLLPLEKVTGYSFLPFLASSV
jgi:hypothetical protein